MKPSLRGATHFAPAYPAACVITQLARVTLVLALIFAATLPSSAGDRRRTQRAVGSVYGWGNDFPNSPTQLSGLSGAVAVAHGRHSLILKSNGTVLARGLNEYGQLGDGTITPCCTEVVGPVQVSGLSDVVAIAVGGAHSIALKSDGTVWTWGLNHKGQLGVVGGDSSIPVQVVGLGGVGFLAGVVAIAAGDSHSLALGNDGTVWAWGYNADGELGFSGPDSRTPVQVTALSGVVAITAGGLYSVALSSDGTVWAWGWNGEGELGTGQAGNPYSTPTPQHVGGGSFSGVVGISSYENHTLAVKSDGTVWAWGTNQFGQLGNGSTASSPTPVQVLGLSGAVAISAGPMFSLALTNDGTVWAWGNNFLGGLGNGSREPSCGTNPVPSCSHSMATQVPGLSGVVAISAGWYSSLALQSQAVVGAWGWNRYGQLGNGVGDGLTNLKSIVPFQAGELTGVAAIGQGWRHSLAVTSNGHVWGWGSNEYGELGADPGALAYSTTPVAVQPGTLYGVVAVAGMAWTSLALKSDGSVWAWGDNSDGLLGIGQDSSVVPYSDTPVQVIGLSDVVAIAGGLIHALALKSDGTVWSWGFGNSGQVGDGTYGLRRAPVQVMCPGIEPDTLTPLVNVVAVAAGEYHSLALTSSGAVWVWGHNGKGQLGYDPGSFSNANRALQVSLLPPMVAVAGGGAHTLALTSSGRVWAWGDNVRGQLGVDWVIASSRYAPAEVDSPDLTNVVALAGSNADSFALRSDGTVWAWGYNTYGDLGNGTTTHSYLPTPVAGMSAGVTAITSAWFHSLALTLPPVAPPLLTIVADDQLLVYGNTLPTLTYHILGPDGLAWQQSGPLSKEPTCVTDASSVGTHPITCSGAEELGYQLAYQDGTLTVNPTPLTITAKPGTKTYGMTLVWVLDGDYPGSYITVEGLRNGDTVTGIGLTTAGAPAAATLGTYAVIPSAAVGTGLTNYDITYVPGTLTVTAPAGALIVTPDSQVMTYGSGVPALTYTVAGLPGGQTLDAGATCLVPGMVAPPAGTHLISCSGAAKDGYQIAYGGATLTVNPAPLTIIADNKSMGLGSMKPLLTASYFGLVNGDTPAIVGGSLGLTTADFGSPVGTYPITFTTVPTLANYTVITVPGTLTVNPGLLTFNNNYFVTGDFAVGSVPLLAAGDGTGFATGTINISSISGDPSNGVPEGADIVAAYLYWQAVEWSGYAPQANGFFRDYTITGEQLGSDLPFSPVPAPELVSGGGSTVMRVYRANVLPYLPLDAEGRRLPAGPHTVRLPHGAASNSGASLVVIYRVLSKDVPLKAVVLYDGAWVKPDGLQLTIRGFYDASGQEEARRFNMASTASAFVPALAPLPPPEGSAGQYSEIFSATAGTAGGMLVFSIAVNDSDGDGLLDAWESAGGYNEVSDGSWVPLPGAANGPKDMFAQLDYMCSAVKPDGTCDPENSRLPQPDPATGQDPLLMVQQAFDASGIKLHYLIGHAIQEETCQDDLTVDPPRLCQFPGEPGVVGWKTGLEVFKVWARDPAGCVAGNADSCRPRFERGQKDSYHYVLFGRSLAVAAWNTRARTLDSIVVSGGNATITTPARAPLNGSTCPTRVTISGALGAPALNGVYNVSSCQGSNTVITVATPGVADWTYSKPLSPADEREPMLAVISGNVSSISGYSDLGGADSAVTLGKWAPNPGQPQNTKANVQAGTLMHELGHTIGLAHGGAYEDTAGSYALTYGGNCKPNYQSIMNYLFQIDLLPGNVLAFSRQALDTMDESAGSVTWTGNPTFPQTRWYVPWSSTVPGSPATRHCDGTPILDGATMVREDHSVSSMTWTAPGDINFDGQVNIALRGYEDLPNIDLRQVGATGGEYVSMAGLLGFGSGGTLKMGSGGTLAMGSGGTLAMGSGGTMKMGSGGTLAMGSGGTLTMGSGGTITFGSGGTLTMGSGGTLALGSGGVVTYNQGDTITPGSGGTLTLGSGGTLTMGSGGMLSFGSGGTLTFGSGGTYAMGSGGTLAMGSGGTLALGSGGTLMMGSGGTLTMGSGGTLALGSGGLLTMGSGGTFTLGSGGTLTMGSGGTLKMGSGGTIAMGSGGTLHHGQRRHVRHGQRRHLHHGQRRHLCPGQRRHLHAGQWRDVHHGQRRPADNGQRRHPRPRQRRHARPRQRRHPRLGQWWHARLGERRHAEDGERRRHGGVDLRNRQLRCAAAERGLEDSDRRGRSAD